MSGLKYLKKEWSRIERGVRGKHLYLFLDFDGTLTPIKSHPRKVKLSLKKRKILKKLLSLEDVSIAIVSGRKALEIQKIINIKGVIYVGNHGFEVRSGGQNFIFPKTAVSVKKTMRLIAGKLKKAFKGYKGMFVENKDFTLAVHFRMARQNEMGKIKQIFERVINPHKLRREIVIKAGKKVWEIWPPINWDKGRIVLQLLEKAEKESKKEVIAFYIGDDKTDEDAFKLLKKKAYTIKVGRGNTLAGYYLRNTLEVAGFLSRLYSLKKKEDIHV